MRLNIKKIPHAHILTRWTQQAKDVLPEHLKPLQNRKTTLEPLSIWQTQLNATALEVVTKGNTDKETIAAVMKHLKAASKEVDEIIFSRSKPTPEPCIADGLDIATDIEEIRGNKYGASGSIAVLSDTEILKMKAPLVEKKQGRPRFKRFRSGADIASKKVAKRVNLGNSSSIGQEETGPMDHRNNNNNKKKPGNCKTRTKSKNLDPMASGKNAGLPFQTRFCTKCRKPGHNRNKCDLRCCEPMKKAQNGNPLRCTKCGLKGHNDEDCLVADLENDSFFK